MGPAVARPTPNPRSIIPPGGEEIWTDVRTKKAKRKAQAAPSEERGLNLMNPTLFKLSEGLLGLGMRADPAANVY